MNHQQTLNQCYQRILSRFEETNPLNQTQKLLTQFRKINSSIQQKLQHYEKLTTSYIQKVSNGFLLSFTKILQKMGNQLLLAEEAYKGIDKQIMAKQKCTSLQNDKLFFIQESTYYKKEYEFKLKQNEKLKDQHYVLIKQNTGLKEKLFEKIKELMFYKKKIKNLQNFQQKVLPGVENSKHQNQDIKFQQGGIDLPQKLIKNIQKQLILGENQKKWASIGKQTAEQKRLKQEQIQLQKKNLFQGIKKQVNKRDKINLDAILNRSYADQSRLEKIQLLRKRRNKVGSRNQSYAERQSQIQFEIEQKSRFGSTFASYHDKMNMRSSSKNSKIMKTSKLNELMAKD